MIEAAKVAPILLKWSRVLKRTKEDPPIDADGIRVWAETLQSVSVTEEELAEASKLVVAKEQWFPSPSIVINYIMTVRSIRARNTHYLRLQRLVECIDERGNSYLAPPERVRDGRLLPPGTRGNGLPARRVEALPGRDPHEGMSANALGLLASITRDEEATNAYRDARARESSKGDHDAETRDAAHEQRIRSQVAAIESRRRK